MDRPLRIALLSYRAHPEVGGQGVYVRRLSDSLTNLGHSVTVFAGPPYPDPGPGVDVVHIPSLDLYRPEDPFRRPARAEFRGPIDLLEYSLMCLGSFPEPLTFSLRISRSLKAAVERFDIVHDNQGLGYGMLGIGRRLPLLTTIHHPISVDRRLALERADGWGKKLSQRRWHSFVRMQARVAKRLPRILAVSESARTDVIRDFGARPERVTVVHNGVESDLFRPLPEVRKIPGRIVTVASSDLASKGLDHLAEAVAKLGTERDVELVVIGRGGQGAAFRSAVKRFGIIDRVHTKGRVDALTLVEELNKAEVAVVPSTYEGFSLPAVEAMACGLPLVATTGGALPEVVGDAGVLVPPADAGALAFAIGELLRDPARAQALGLAARRRVLERFTWDATAASTAALYREVMGDVDR